MRILIVSWEYPPVVVGGLGRHVHQLATHLSAAGHEVVVLTRQPSGTDAASHPTSSRFEDGVLIVSAAEDAPGFDFGQDLLAWTLAMNHSLIRAGLALRLPGAGEGWVPDVVHAHDWLVAHAGIALAEFYDIPLVTTIHATEAGRHSGWLSGRLNQQVHSVEWWLANESDALVTCSGWMRDEVTRLFGPALPSMSVIRNGIDVNAWTLRDGAPHDGPPVLLFAGRLEYEKGVQDAIAALPAIRKAFPGTVLRVAGEGTQHEWLQDEARKHHVARSVEFLGQLEHEELLEELHRADALVLPSHYEPFGIIALEAAASGTPVVASTAGGLSEAIVDGRTGLSFHPGDIAALTAAVLDVLRDPDAARRRAAAARDRLTEDFGWDRVADSTVEVYESAKRRVRTPLGRPEIPQRPLPERDS